MFWRGGLIKIASKAQTVDQVVNLSFMSPGEANVIDIVHQTEVLRDIKVGRPISNFRCAQGFEQFSRRIPQIRTQIRAQLLMI